MTIGKSKQRYFLDGSALPGSRETRVMHDPTVADIYAMVAIPTTRTLQVCAETGFPLEPQWPPRLRIRVFGHWQPVIHGARPFNPLSISCWPYGRLRESPAAQSNRTKTRQRERP